MIFEENYVALIVPLDRIYHRRLTLPLSWSHGWFSAPSYHMSTLC